jgi:cytochrome P450
MSVSYDPWAPGFTEDPYPQYATLRSEDPVHETALGFWVLTRYDDVVRFLRDTGLSVEDRNARSTVLDQLARETVGDRADRGSYAMLNRDPPDHTRLRRLVSKAFTPRVVEGLRPRIQELVDEALDAAEARGGMELIGDLAFPLPFTVISEMLGMPETDHEQLRQWSGALVKSLEPQFDPAEIRAVAEASDAMRELTAEVIAWKRREPSDDLLSALIAAEEHGDVLSDEELTEQVILLYVAGHETTVNLIGNGTLALLRHRRELERLAHDPSLAANAVEELLRYDSPVQMTRRITLEDVEVDGRRIEGATFVVLVLASANRDERQWGPAADALDLRRDGAQGHVSFGGGAHHCLGAALARLEGQVAFASLAARFPRMELAAEPEWNGRINLRGLTALPVTTPASRGRNSSVVTP